MADKTNIEWTGATWNPITGCTILSPGCVRCYAMKLAGGRLQHHPSRKGLTKKTKNGPVWTGEVRFNEGWLNQPLHWTVARGIFVCAHADLFHENVPDAWIDRVFDVMEAAWWHHYQVLTKRSGNMRRYVNARYAGKEPPAHIWFGVSAERQKEAEERIPDLLATSAAVRFVSLEPLLGAINLHSLQYESGILLPESMRVNDERCSVNALTGVSTWPGCHYQSPVIKREALIQGEKLFESQGESRSLDWVIVGGESGAGAQPMHPEWVRSLRDQCAAAGKLDRFFFKQWGMWAPGENVERHKGIVKTATWFDERWLISEENLANDEGHVDDEPDLYLIGKGAAGRLLDGIEHNGMPI